MNLAMVRNRGKATEAGVRGGLGISSEKKEGQEHIGV